MAGIHPHQLRKQSRSTGLQPQEAAPDLCGEKGFDSSSLGAEALSSFGVFFNGLAGSATETRALTALQEPHQTIYILEHMYTLYLCETIQNVPLEY